MALGKKPLFQWLSNFLSRVPGFTKFDTHSIHFLNIAQFMGVLNDNIFKLVIAYLLIAILGAQYASTILAISGAVFVIP
ncbi:MAG: hypothetical protein ABSA17_08785, partial [Rhabdochlamydiaceae bacterium]